ncbi:hypothetical protein AX17_000650 [Amanita inopinata Kibby_2008]|nr:hypothetical protein AX17_000650 [Amanita inopinata Kibby_2008]
MQLTETPMPLTIRMAGRMYAFAFATKAVIFVAFVWAVPSYAIKPPPRVIIRRIRARSSSISSATSAASTPSTLVYDNASVVGLFNDPVIQSSVEHSQKKRKVMKKISSSFSPLAKHLPMPSIQSKRLAVFIPVNISPRKAVIGAQQKCSAFISDHSNLPRRLPQLKKSTTRSMPNLKSTYLAETCTTLVKKMVSPIKVPSKLKRQPRRRASI